jgi:fucose 4-O-acetylase-like acetyltransferase
MKSLPEAASLEALTPTDRDRYVDLLRAISIGVVVFGHWLMAVVYWGAHGTGGGNALSSIPALTFLTWVLQIMPVFFFVGGFSNWVTLERLNGRGSGWRAYLGGRVERLLRPTIPFAATWLIVGGVMQAIGGERVRPALEVIAKPLWFLAVYVMVVAVAPAMVALHRRYRWGVPIALGAAAILVDVVRLGAGLGWIGPINYAFVWLLAHQLGFFYADGTFARWPLRRFAAMAAGGLGTLIVLTTVGSYPVSLVGLPGERISNMNPPSVCIVAVTVWLIGLAMLARGAATRWVARPATWRRVVAANSIIMTAFLWHLTAMLIGVVTLLPLGFPQPEVGTSGWWLARVPWLGALGIILAGLVRAFAHHERPGRARVMAATTPVRAAASAVALTAGLAILALHGFDAPTTGPLAGVPIEPAVALGLLLAGRRLAVGRSLAVSAPGTDPSS